MFCTSLDRHTEEALCEAGELHDYICMLEAWRPHVSNRQVLVLVSAMFVCLLFFFFKDIWFIFKSAM